MKNKIVCFGEIMLRLKSPSSERLLQSPMFEATFGGGEANVAVSLSYLGKKSSYVTAVPDNALGDSAIRELQKHGVDITNCIRSPGRMGLYFLESGSMQRPSTVLYDRAESSIAKASFQDFDWKAIFQDAVWFHITGITPAISQAAAESSLEAVKQAKKAGLQVSIDLNYRNKLWQYGKKAPEVMNELVKYADLLVANEEDIQKSLGIEAEVDVAKGKLEIESYKALISKLQEKFPQIKHVAITLRESFSADNNSWSALLSGEKGFYESKKYELKDIVDRVGGGDAFSAALIFALLENQKDEQAALDFAVASSALKHSILGDFNFVTKAEVENLLKGDASGRVQR